MGREVVVSYHPLLSELEIHHLHHHLLVPTLHTVHTHRIPPVLVYAVSAAPPSCRVSLSFSPAVRPELYPTAVQYQIRKYRPVHPPAARSFSPHPSVSPHPHPTYRPCAVALIHPLVLDT